MRISARTTICAVLLLLTAVLLLFFQSSNGDDDDLLISRTVVISGSQTRNSALGVGFGDLTQPAVVLNLDVEVDPASNVKGMKNPVVQEEGGLVVWHENTDARVVEDGLIKKLQFQTRGLLSADESFAAVMRGDLIIRGPGPGVGGKPQFFLAVGDLDLDAEGLEEEDEGGIGTTGDFGDFVGLVFSKSTPRKITVRVKPKTTGEIGLGSMHAPPFDSGSTDGKLFLAPIKDGAPDKNRPVSLPHKIKITQAMLEAPVGPANPLKIDKDTFEFSYFLCSHDHTISALIAEFRATRRGVADVSENRPADTINVAVGPKITFDVVDREPDPDPDDSAYDASGVNWNRLQFRWQETAGIITLSNYTEIRDGSTTIGRRYVYIVDPNDIVMKPEGFSGQWYFFSLSAEDNAGNGAAQVQTIPFNYNVP